MPTYNYLDSLRKMLKRKWQERYHNKKVLCTARFEKQEIITFLWTLVGDMYLLEGFKEGEIRTLSSSAHGIFVDDADFTPKCVRGVLCEHINV